MPYTYVTSLLPSAVGGIPVRTTPATVLIVRIHLLWAAGDTTLCVSATSVCLNTYGTGTAGPARVARPTKG